VKPVEHVFVGGVKAATLSRAELARHIVADCLERRAAKKTAPPALLFDSNGQGISMAARDRTFAEALNTADVVHADGGWIVLASRFVAGAAIPDRSATTDMIHDLAAAGLEHGLSHFLLGATEEIVREAMVEAGGSKVVNHVGRGRTVRNARACDEARGEHDPAPVGVHNVRRVKRVAVSRITRGH
jgi:UDP-N-acetyl-D-mannosaminuronic acid transferase (WecB/TagA/CpsF family)